LEKPATSTALRALGSATGALVLLALIACGVFYFDPLWVNDQQIRYHLWRANVRSEYVEAGGYRLHYFEATPPDGSPGVPLVLIHGLGSRGEDWAPMVPTLAAAGFHVYVPDLLGFGRSAKPDVPYSLPLEENVALAFLNAIHLQHADVAGWSMGGWIAAALALDQPQRVDRLVLYDSLTLSFDPTVAQDAFVPTDTASLNRLVSVLTPHPRRLPGFVVRATLRKFHRTGWIVQRTMDSIFTKKDALDDRIANVHQPTLIVWGSEDRLIPIAVGQTLHRDIPGSVFVSVQGCGHLAPGECAKPVLASTIEFLKSQPPRRGGDETLSASNQQAANPQNPTAR
jgi:pimeloyl-ACP methyl ester carboxylesterase